MPHIRFFATAGGVCRARSCRFGRWGASAFRDSEEVALLDTETDDFLVDCFAGLLASASAGLRHPAFLAFVTQLTSHDARVLDALYGLGWNSPPGDHIEQNAGITFEEFTIVKDNLWRLGLIRPGFGDSQQPDGGAYYSNATQKSPPLFHDKDTIHTAKTLRLTPIGERFVEACHGPKAQSRST